MYDINFTINKYAEKINVFPLVMTLVYTEVYFQWRGFRSSHFSLNSLKLQVYLGLRKTSL